MATRASGGRLRSERHQAADAQEHGERVECLPTSGQEESRAGQAVGTWQADDVPGPRRANPVARGDVSPTIAAPSVPPQATTYDMATGEFTVHGPTQLPEGYG